MSTPYFFGRIQNPPMGFKILAFIFVKFVTTFANNIPMSFGFPSKFFEKCASLFSPIHQ
jgi:hypothetical protein